MKKYILLASSIVMINLLVVGCSTSNDTQNCIDALTGDLTFSESSLVGNWALTAMVSEEAIDLTSDGTDNPSTDIFEQFSECDRDVVYSFQNDRKFAFRLGYSSTLCDNKESVDGTWKFDQNQLTLVIGCATQTIIIALNSTFTSFNIEGTYSFQDVNGLNVTTKVTSTYTKSM